MVLALVIKAFQIYNKAKILKDAIDVLAKKKVDKVDKILSYIPGNVGKFARFCKKAADNTKEMNIRIDRNKRALDYLMFNASKWPGAQDTRWFKYNQNRFLKNISKAKNNKDNFVFEQIKKNIKNKLLHLIPGRGIFLSQKALAEAIYDKEGWKKIAQRLGIALSKVGFPQLSKTYNMIHRLGCIHITADGYWRSISENHSSLFPIIGPKGANSIMKIQLYKDELTKDLWDRTFYFYANSPQTQNFSQDIHAYNCATKEYTMPIRGWYGKKVKKYTYPNIRMNSVLIIILKRLDFGEHYWRHYATFEAVKWIPIYASNWKKAKKK